MKRTTWLGRLRKVLTHYTVTLSALRLLAERVQADPNFGQARGWRQRDLGTLLDDLEGTYLIRMFAEFESGLRDAWEKSFRQTTHPRTRDLMIAITARQRIPQDWHDSADRVRTRRNALVHEVDEQTDAIPGLDAHRSLARYLSRLPLDWR